MEEDHTIGVMQGNQVAETNEDHTMGVILAVSAIGAVIGLLAACGIGQFVGWWFG